MARSTAARNADDPDRLAHERAFVPSEYTGLLIGALRTAMLASPAASVLELGTGSGAVLAAAILSGAKSVTGVDVEEDAVTTTRSVLAGLGVPHDIHCGDMWAPVAGRRFDLIVANLPHFPMDTPDTPGRHATWSYGGTDGRLLLDGFLARLPDHLAVPHGRALVTHNAFVGLPATGCRAAAAGLRLKVVCTTTVHIPPAKAARLSARARQGQAGSHLHQFGPYLFGDVHVIELSWPSGA